MQREFKMEYLKIILTSLFSVFAMLVMAKFSGHRLLGELDVFDFISSITVGSIGAEIATDIKAPFEAAAALPVWLAAIVIITKCNLKFHRFRKVVSGSPALLFYNGKLLYGELKKAKLQLGEFLMLCRQAGYFDLSDIRAAVFELNGTLSILPTEKARSLTPEDMELSPERDDIFTEVIMDGRIMHSDLKKRGLSLPWLKKELKSQNIGSEKEVFLGLVGADGTLTVYKYENL